MASTKEFASGRVERLSSQEPDASKNAAPVADKPVPSDVPDGGFLAWIQCAGAFILFLNSWGIVNMFGAYQTFYEQSLLSTRSSSDISWIGSIQACLLMLGSVVVGPLYDSGYLRTLVITGSALVVFGMMMTSLCTEFWQLILAQGLIIGLGNGCLFVPSIALLPTYFTTWRAFAMGIAASGSSVGGVLYPIIFHELQPRIGFGWATRVIAFIMLATLIVPVFGMKMRVTPSTVRPRFDTAAWREMPFALFACAVFLGFLGLYIPFFYVQLYSIEHAIVDTSLVFYLVPLLNAGSLFGRVIPNYFADRAGPLNVMAACTFAASILAFVWIGIGTTAGVLVFCILYGFFSGSFIGLSAPVMTQVLCPHLGVLGVRLGMLSIPMAAGILIGNPIVGAIRPASWAGLQIFCGAAVGLSAICMTVARAKAPVSPKQLPGIQFRRGPVFRRI